MENKYIILKKCSLFDTIDENQIKSMLSCLVASENSFEKNEFIYQTGDRVSKIGIILSGSINIIKEDFWGNRSIISHISIGDLFGESFSFSGNNKITMDVLSNEKTEVLFIDYGKIITTCSSACEFHTTLIRNMLKILANKNVTLTGKMEHLTKRTTKEKLLSYLSEQSIKYESNSFTIPFNRQELADYLSVERSAMSNELSKMRNEGLISYNKNNFILH